MYASPEFDDSLLTSIIQTFIDYLANTPLPFSSRLNAHLEICLNTPEIMLVGSISELVEPDDINIPRYGALIRFTLRKMVGWLDRLEDQMRLCGERILGFKRLRRRSTIPPYIVGG